jgi:hypothetical protein
MPITIPIKNECIFHLKRHDCYTTPYKRNKYPDTVLHVTNLDLSEEGYLGVPDSYTFGVFDFVYKLQNYISVGSIPLNTKEWQSIVGMGATNKDKIKFIGEFIIKLLHQHVNRIEQGSNRFEQHLVIFQNNFIDLLCNIKDDRFYFLPQAMATIPPQKHLFHTIIINGYPPQNDIIDNQLFYQKFIIYNTLLTALLNEENPLIKYDNKPSMVFKHIRVCKRDKALKQISKLERTKWSVDKEHIGVCTLKFKLSEFNSNHVLCLSKSFIKRVLTYAKLYDNPQKLKTYGSSVTTIKTKTNQRISVPVNQLAEWDNQLNQVFNYFNINYRY